MQETKSSDAKSSSDSQGRSALEDGMDRVCEKLDEEKAASITLSTKHRLPKVVRRRLIPLKGENPAAAR
jgi:phosphoribosyl-ATP pyrophosphohydrolase